MAWTRPGVGEAVVLAVVLAIALVVRVSALDDTPAGFQGDEATAGLLGRRIAAEGWIGPYTTLMAGDPTGFYYLVAGAMTVVDHDVLAVRLVSATLGVLTVAALYVLVRRNFGVPAAVAGAALLATAGWHIHLSRLGFPTVSWPLAVVVAVLALVEAVRTGDRRWWLTAGALFGLGLYTHDSQVLLLGVVAPLVLFLLFGAPVLAAGAGFALFATRPSFLTLVVLAAVMVWAMTGKRVQDRRLVASALAFVVALLLVGSVLFRHIAENRATYFDYGSRISIFNTAEWAAETTTAGKIGFVGDRYVEFWDRLCCHPRIDAVDATGVTALMPLPMLLLAIVGVGFSFVGAGRIAASIAGVLAVSMPLAVIATNDFAMRRALVVAPLVAMFAGIGVAGAVRWAWGRQPRTRYPVIALVVIVATLSVYRNLDNYFGPTLDSQPIHWVLAVEMVDASNYVDDLPDDAYVLFFSDRWPWGHEIRRYFAPDARGEDRGEHFGTYGFATDPALGRPVFLFIDAYRDDVVNAAIRYPGGETIVAGDPADPDFVVYVPPAGMTEQVPASTELPPVATPTTEPGGRG